MAQDENGNGPRKGIRFDWTFNIGHVATIVTLLSAMAFAWNAMASQINVVDDRTRDYQSTRDLARATDAQLKSMVALVQSVGNTNDSMRQDVTKIRENIAAINATLAERRTP